MSQTSANAGKGDPQNDKTEAIKVLEDLRSAVFFKKLQSKVTDTKHKTSIMDEEKDKVFNMFAKSHPMEDQHAELLDEDVDLDTIQKNRLPKINKLLMILFHGFLIASLLLTLDSSYEYLKAEASDSALVVAKEYNCLERLANGNFLRHSIDITHGGLTIVLLFTRRRRVSGILLAFVFIQAVDTSFDIIQMTYRIRFPTVSVFNGNLAVGIMWHLITLLVGIGSVLMVMQRYYDLAIPVKIRERRLKAESYGKRFLNDQIVYKNAPSFLQRKYVLRKATAFQIYSVLRTISEESSTRHKRGQKVKFDPIFTREHIQHAKHDEAMIEQLSEETIMKIIRGRSALRIHKLEAERVKRRQSILQKNIASMKNKTVSFNAVAPVAESVPAPVQPQSSNVTRKKNN